MDTLIENIHEKLQCITHVRGKAGYRSIDFVEVEHGTQCLTKIAIRKQELRIETHPENEGDFKFNPERIHKMDTEPHLFTSLGM